jgi:indole-3-glycerol phosphate synthase
LLDLDGLARDIGLDVLVEVHDEEELEDALATGAALIGVNNRDLRSFTTDLATSQRLRPLVPGDRTMVTESGIHCREDVTRLRQCGINVFLVGEAFMRREDPGEALHDLFFGDKPE